MYEEDVSKIYEEAEAIEMAAFYVSQFFYHLKDKSQPKGAGKGATRCQRGNTRKPGMYLKDRKALARHTDPSLVA